MLCLIHFFIWTPQNCKAFADDSIICSTSRFSGSMYALMPRNLANLMILCIFLVPIQYFQHQKNWLDKIYLALLIVLDSWNLLDMRIGGSTITNTSIFKLQLCLWYNCLSAILGRRHKYFCDYLNRYWTIHAALIRRAVKHIESQGDSNARLLRRRKVANLL